MTTGSNVIKFQPRAKRRSGYTPVPHDLMDAVMSGRFKAQQARVLLAVARLTLGWQQERAVLTLGQIAEVTDMKATHIAKALRELEAMGAIEVAYTKAGRIIGIIEDYDSWSDETGHSKSVTSDQIGHHPVTKSVTPSYIDKENIKENKKASAGAPAAVVAEQKPKAEKPAAKPKSAKLVLPDWLDPQAWDDFVAFRKRTAPLTDRAAELAIAKLDALRKGGNDPKAVIEQSILNGWRGLFPIKGDNGPRNEPEVRRRKLA